MPKREIEEAARLSIEEIIKRRQKRERRSMAVARRFESTVSIDEADENEQGKKQIPVKHFMEAVNFDPDGIGDTTEYTDDELDFIRRSMSRLLVGTGASIVLKCPGKAECPFQKNCPFAAKGKEPVGKDCVVESMLFSEMLKQSMYTFEVDPTNIVDVMYVNEFVSTRLLLRRAEMLLGDLDKSSLVIEEEYETKSGDVISATQISPWLEARDKLVRRMERITKLMVGDRQEKYKKAAALKQKNLDDASIDQARKRAALSSAKVKAELAKKADEDAEILTPDDVLLGRIKDE